MFSVSTWERIDNFSFHKNQTNSERFETSMSTPTKLWVESSLFPSQNCFRMETVCAASDSVMENDTCVEEKSCDGPTAVDPVKQPVSIAPFRYTKVRIESD